MWVLILLFSIKSFLFQKNNITMAFSFKHFILLNLQSIFANINRILSEAGKLIESGHYASSHVRGVAARLDGAWKEFAGGLDERTTVLALSVMFHQKAEQVAWLW